MNLLVWKVSFHPFRFLRAFLMFSLVFATAAWADPVGNSETLPLDPAQENGVQVVQAVLAKRMPHLDGARRLDLARTIVRESVQTSFDPLFVLAVIQAESSFDHEAVSPTGARGLMQVVPKTWKEQVARSNLGWREKFNPSHNAQVGIHYLAHLARAFHRPETVMLAYNQGPGDAGNILANRKPRNEEAAKYVPTVMAAYRKFLKDHGLDAKRPRNYWRSPYATIVKAETAEGSEAVALR